MRSPCSSSPVTSGRGGCATSPFLPMIFRGSSIVSDCGARTKPRQRRNPRKTRNSELSICAQCNALLRRRIQVRETGSAMSRQKTDQVLCSTVLSKHALPALRPIVTLIVVLGVSASVWAQSAALNETLRQQFVEQEFAIKSFGPARWLSGGQACTTVEASPAGPPKSKRSYATTLPQDSAKYWCQPSN